MSSETPTRHHYFLIAGIMLFSTSAEAADNDSIGSAPANAVVRHDTTTFGVAQLQKAQQNLHKAFVLKMPEEARAVLNMHDIVITNVSYLGEMSEDEFQKPVTIEDIIPPVPAVREVV